MKKFRRYRVRDMVYVDNPKHNSYLKVGSIVKSIYNDPIDEKKQAYVIDMDGMDDIYFHNQLQKIKKGHTRAFMSFRMIMAMLKDGSLPPEKFEF